MYRVFVDPRERAAWRPPLAPGDAVRVRSESAHRTEWRRPHLRTPGYIHGAQGVVVGPATSTAVEGKGVAVQFPKNETACECFLHELSCEPLAEGLG